MALYADHARLPFRQSHSDEPSILSEILPAPGVLIIELSFADEVTRYRILAALNELRARLAAHGSGAVIVVGPTAVRVEAALKAADLWSVRSFAVDVDPSAEPSGSVSSFDSETEGDVALAGVVFPAMVVPAELRTPGSTRVLRELERAAMLCASDLTKARKLATGARQKSEAGSFVRLIAELAEAELAALDQDAVMVALSLREGMLVDAAKIPSRKRISVLRPAIDVALRSGVLDVATELADAQLAASRELAERLGTPEATRDLSVSLNNVARVAEARGDWAAAGDGYGESLGLARELAERLGTPEATRDLSVSLNNVARVAARAATT
ncbi:MAG: hypothetical protein FWD74_10405 [Actinomycetia bacterium]|nr:hypothetical protein [Actinomycetes bacterium]